MKLVSQCLWGCWFFLDWRKSPYGAMTMAIDMLGRHLISLNAQPPKWR